MNERGKEDNLVHTRYDTIGPIKLLIIYNGIYYMVRRPGSMPFILTRKEWESLSKEPYAQPPRE